MRRIAGDVQGNGADGPDVVGNVFADDAVAAGDAADELALFINEVDCQAVDFQFDDVFQIFAAQVIADALVEFPQFIVAEDVAQAEHGPVMGIFFKAAGNLGAYALRRRIGRDPVGVGFFDVFQFPVHHIVFIISHCRLVEGVILITQFIYFFPQLQEPRFFSIHGFLLHS